MFFILKLCSCYLRNLELGYLNVFFSKHRKRFNTWSVRIFKLTSLGEILLLYFQTSIESEVICGGVFSFFSVFFCSDLCIWQFLCLVMDEVSVTTFLKVQ